MDNPTTTRIRPRFSRTLSHPRWSEYRGFLLAAQQRGYRTVPLEDWVRDPGNGDAPSLILRHDIDQHPRSALAMAKVETDLGVRSSWYFRWRTAHPSIVDALKDGGFQIGLHYETLTRKALERGLTDPPDQVLIEESRIELRKEISAFARLFGPIRSVVPHGDSRVPGVHNADLLRGQDCSDYGVEFDGNEAMRGRGLAYWLTDRSAPEGGWKDGTDPIELFASLASPILCVTHPNNWASGPSLWWDRVLSAALPTRPWDSSHGPGRPVRTGSDLPPR